VVLITGGAGYIGSHTALYLHEQGIPFLIIDNLRNGRRESVSKGQLIVGDLQDEDFLDDVFKNNSIDAVIHFAGYIEVGESVKCPGRFYQNNLISSLNILNAMEKYDCKKIVFSSTCAVYGTPDRSPIDETLPLTPINPYGRTKLMVEQILEDFKDSHGISSVSLRYFNAAGADSQARIGEAHNPETHLIPILLDCLRFDREFIINGKDYATPDGSCIRDFIHVMDLAGAHKAALDYLDNTDSQICESFNIGSGCGYSVLEVIKVAEKVTRKKVNVRIGPSRKGDAPILVADNKKAVSVLGWQAKHSDLETILRDAWKWMIRSES